MVNFVPFFLFCFFAVVIHQLQCILFVDHAYYKVIFSPYFLLFFFLTKLRWWKFWRLPPVKPMNQTFSWFWWSLVLLDTGWDWGLHNHMPTFDKKFYVILSVEELQVQSISNPLSLYFFFFGCYNRIILSYKWTSYLMLKGREKFPTV